MLQQKYYRLAELERSFGLSLENLRYLVENDQLHLIFKKPSEKYLIGLLNKQQKFIGFGSANYSGYFSLSKIDQLELIKKGKVRSNRMWLLQHSEIRRLEADYPYRLPSPNLYIQKWIKKDSIEVSDQIWAMPYLNETEGLARGFLTMLADFGENPIEKDNDSLDKFPENTLIPNSMILSHDDICVTRIALKKLGLIEDDKPKNAKTENAFKRLVHNLIKRHPQKGAAALWNHLYDNHETDESLDPESILDEVGRDELSWVQGKDSARTVTKKRFRNMVSEEKNK